MKHTLVGNIINWAGWTLRSGIAFDPLAPIKPTSCPLEFWFDGQDATTFTLNGNKVIQWDDKSGNARHVDNAIDARRPTYDPVTGRVTFMAALQTYLQCTALAFGPAMVQPNTIYVVYKITGALGVDCTVFTGNGNFLFLNEFDYTVDQFKIWSGVYLIDGARNNLNNIHIGEFNGLTSNYWINGINCPLCPGNIGNNSLDGITLGASRLLAFCADIEIMEVFGFSCLLTNQEHYNLHEYVNNKWSLGWPNPW